MPERNPARGGIPLRYARDLAPARCRSARLNRNLAPQATGIQGAILSDPGIRGPLHPQRRRCPPSPYRSGYASVGRLAGSGASTLSMHGLSGNGPLEAGLPQHRLESPSRLPVGAQKAQPDEGGRAQWGSAQPCRFTARARTEPPSEAAERDLRPLDAFHRGHSADIPFSSCTLRSAPPALRSVPAQRSEDNYETQHTERRTGCRT